MGAKFQKIVMRGITVLAMLSMLVGTLPGGALPALAAPGDTTRVSVDSSGAQANGWSWSGPAAISDDGRYVAFKSDASNLVRRGYQRRGGYLRT